MTVYLNRSGRSGVRQYEFSDPHSIDITFKGGRTYTYSDSTYGEWAIQQLQLYANGGEYANRFINAQIKGQGDASKLPSPFEIGYKDKNTARNGRTRRSLKGIDKEYGKGTLNLPKPYNQPVFKDSQTRTVNNTYDRNQRQPVLSNNPATVNASRELQSQIDRLNAINNRRKGFTEPKFNVPGFDRRYGAASKITESTESADTRKRDLDEFDANIFQTMDKILQSQLDKQTKIKSLEAAIKNMKEAIRLLKAE